MFATIERLICEANSYQDLGQTANKLNQDNNLNLISQSIIQMLLGQHEVMIRQGTHENEIFQRLHKYKNHIKLLLNILTEDIYQNLSSFILTSQQSVRTIEDQQIYGQYLIHTTDSQSIASSPSFSQNTQSHKFGSIKQSNTPTSQYQNQNDQLPGHPSLVDRRKTIDVLRHFNQTNESPHRSQENITTQQNIMANYKLQVFCNRTNTIEYPMQSNLDMNQIQGIQFTQESSQDRYKRSFQSNQKGIPISSSVNSHSRSTSQNDFTQQMQGGSFIAKNQKRQSFVNSNTNNNNTRNPQPPLAMKGNNGNKQISNKSQIINHHESSTQGESSTKQSMIRQELERLKGSQKTEYLNNLVYSSFQNPKGPGSFKREQRFNHQAGRIPTIINDKENSPGPGFYEDQVLTTKRASVGPATFYRAKKETIVDEKKSCSPGVGSYNKMESSNPTETDQRQTQQKQPEQENPATFLKIEAMLQEKGIQYKLTTHEPVLTSKAAAEIRGATLASGAKAMLLKDNSKGVAESALFYLAVMSASKKFSWKHIKKLLKIKNMRFATPEEVYDRTGCLPGAVPPFGSVFLTPTLVDESLRKQGDTINFNCGLRTHSIRMGTQDYLDLEKPKLIGVFTEDGEEEGEAQ